MKRNNPILVLGATGRVGGATARALLDRGHEVRALTRNPDAPAARRLAAQGAAVVYGDLDDAASIRSAMSGVGGLFVVQGMPSRQAAPDAETRQARVIGEAALDAGVRHVVYTSIDGAERHSGVPQLNVKQLVEQHFRDLGIALTILRATMFMENFTDAYSRPTVVDGTVLVRMAVRAQVPIQLISIADIAAFAAIALERPTEYAGRAIALAGDELTGPHIAETFHAVTGAPARFEQQPIEELQAMNRFAALLWRWIDGVGYSQADIAALRAQHPQLHTFRSWMADTEWAHHRQATST